LISYQDFLNWKSDPVTRVVFGAIQDKMEKYKEILVEDAGKDPESDRFMCGYIRACDDVLNTEYEGEEE
jgi:hypothetical protein